MVLLIGLQSGIQAHKFWEGGATSLFSAPGVTKELSRDFKFTMATPERRKLLDLLPKPVVMALTSSESFTSSSSSEKSRSLSPSASSSSDLCPSTSCGAPLGIEVTNPCLSVDEGGSDAKRFCIFWRRCSGSSLVSPLM